MQDNIHVLAKVVDRTAKNLSPLVWNSMHFCMQDQTIRLEHYSKRLPKPWPPIETETVKQSKKKWKSNNQGKIQQNVCKR